MFIKTYNQLTDTQKDLACQCIAQRTYTTIGRAHDILTRMNPPIEIEKDKVVLFHDTLLRIRHKVIQEAAC